MSKKTAMVLLEQARTELLRRRVQELRDESSDRARRSKAKSILETIDVVDELAAEARDPLEDRDYKGLLFNVMAEIVKEGGNIEEPDTDSWPSQLRNEAFALLQKVWLGSMLDLHAAAEYLGGSFTQSWLDRVFRSTEFRTWQSLGKSSHRSALQDLATGKAVEILMMRSTRPSIIATQAKLAQQLIEDAEDEPAPTRKRKRPLTPRKPIGGALDG